ncbi:MAG: malectin domain-containing carbohydrate-binding protein, partial [Cyanobacteria bacterium P01_C01_bin.120]
DEDCELIEADKDFGSDADQTFATLSYQIGDLIAYTTRVVDSQYNNGTYAEFPSGLTIRRESDLDFNVSCQYADWVADSVGSSNFRIVSSVRNNFKAIAAAVFRPATATPFIDIFGVVTTDESAIIATNVVYAINCGGTALVDEGFDFVADNFFDNGSVYTGNATSQPGVYATERFGNPFSYTLPVTAGETYTVKILLAENFYTAAGERVMSIAINGVTVLNNYDIYAEIAGGQVIQSFSGIAPDGSNNIVITGTATADNAKFNGIVIETEVADEGAAIDIAGNVTSDEAADITVSRGLDITNTVTTNEAEIVTISRQVDFTGIVDTDEAVSATIERQVNITGSIITNEAATLQVNRRLNILGTVETNESAAIAANDNDIDIIGTVETDEQGSLSINRTLLIAGTVVSDEASIVRADRRLNIDGTVSTDETANLAANTNLPIQGTVTTTENVAAQIDRDLNITGIVDTDESTALTIDVSLPIQSIVTTNESAAIVSGNELDILGTVTTAEQITINVDRLLDVSGTVIAAAQSALTIARLLDISGTVTTDETVAFAQPVRVIDFGGVVTTDEAVDLTSDRQLLITGSITSGETIALSIAKVLLVAGVVSTNERAVLTIGEVEAIAPLTLASQVKTARQFKVGKSARQVETIKTARRL